MQLACQNLRVSGPNVMTECWCFKNVKKVKLLSNCMQTDKQLKKGNTLF